MVFDSSQVFPFFWRCFFLLLIVACLTRATMQIIIETVICIIHRRLYRNYSWLLYYSCCVKMSSTLMFGAYSFYWRLMVDREQHHELLDCIGTTENGGSIRLFTKIGALTASQFWRDYVFHEFAIGRLASAEKKTCNFCMPIVYKGLQSRAFNLSHAIFLHTNAQTPQLKSDKIYTKR